MRLQGKRAVIDDIKERMGASPPTWLSGAHGSAREVAELFGCRLSYVLKLAHIASREVCQEANINPQEVRRDLAASCATALRQIAQHAGKDPRAWKAYRQVAELQMKVARFSQAGADDPMTNSTHLHQTIQILNVGDAPKTLATNAAALAMVPKALRAKPELK